MQICIFNIQIKTRFMHYGFWNSSKNDLENKIDKVRAHFNIQANNHKLPQVQHLLPLLYQFNLILTDHNNITATTIKSVILLSVRIFQFKVIQSLLKLFNCNFIYLGR